MTELKLDNENTRKEYKRFEILGISENELICLESVTNVCCCGEKSGQIHIITMRPLTEETIDYNRSEEALRDLWVDAVNADATNDSLEDWVDDANYDADCNDMYFPFDDTSYRSETNYALENLTEQEQEKIKEFFDEYCDNDNETFKDFEVSSSSHYDLLFIKDGCKFDYVTSFGKKFTPLFNAFYKGELDYNGLVNQLVAYVKEN